MTAESQNLIWRPMAVSDGAAMADLLNAIDAEDHVWGQYTAEDAAAELDSPVDAIVLPLQQRRAPRGERRYVNRSYTAFSDPRASRVLADFGRAPTRRTRGAK